MMHDGDVRHANIYVQKLKCQHKAEVTEVEPIWMQYFIKLCNNMPCIK